MGAISALGPGVPALWDGLSAGRDALREITLFDASPYRNSRGGEVTGYAADPSNPRALRFLEAAAAEALADAGLDAGGRVDLERAAILLGTNFGGMSAAERMLAPHGGDDAGEEGLDRYNFMCGADRIAEKTGFAGSRTVLSLSCASGTAVLGLAADAIRLGRADVVLTGGFDELSEFCYAGLSALRAITPDVVRPFDKNRKGTMFSEGAGVLILEGADHAAARGARVHAELLGRALNNDAYHMTAPEKQGRGIQAVMRAALRDAGLEPERVDHINTHGTGTPYNDKIETRAIKQVFGPHAAAMPLTAVKSIIGHAMGAAGSLEAICTVQTIREGLIPPTIHFETPDPECDLDYCPGQARAADVRIALSNSYGIGGTNACVVLRRWEEGG